MLNVDKNGCIQLVINRILVAVVVAMALVSCSTDLSEQELSIIKNNIPDKMFEEEVLSLASDVNSYLWDGVDEYAEKTRKELQTALTKKNAVINYLGWQDDIFGQALLGDKPEKNAGRYEQYVDYVNSHQSAMANLIESIAGVVVKNPEVIKQYNNGDIEKALAPFRSLEGMPSDLNVEMLGSGNGVLDEMDQCGWGEAVMGSYDKPSMSAPVILDAVFQALSDCSKPKPVYAVYDEDEELWVVGYDNEEAIKLEFTEKGDVLHYEYIFTEYSDAYAKSKYNVLKKN